jgi:hypothetical protein
MRIPQNRSILWGENGLRQNEGLNLETVDRKPEFRRYCRPFAPESAGPQPALVIPFNTEITFGLNFFGQRSRRKPRFVDAGVQVGF